MNFNIDTEEGLANAVAWQERLVATITPGGRWYVPRSGTIYMLDHDGKQAKRVAGLCPEPLITRVFEAMGWKVIDE